MDTQEQQPQTSAQEFVKGVALLSWDRSMRYPIGCNVLKTEESICLFLQELTNNENYLICHRYTDAFAFTFHRTRKKDEAADREEALQMMRNLVGPKLVDEEIKRSGIDEFFKTNPPHQILSGNAIDFHIMCNDMDDPFIKEEEDPYEVIVAIMHQLKGRLGSLSAS